MLLGVTAAQALIGPNVKVGESRGRPLDCDLAELVTVTVHPSSILRVSERDERHQAMDEFVADLTVVRQYLAGTDTA